MRLEIPLDAADVLEATSIKTDYPDVWGRYISDRVIRVNRSLKATVETPVGRLDLIVIMEYLRCWLKEQDRISEDEKPDYAARNLKGSVSHAVLRIAAAIEAAQQECPHHGAQCPETGDMLVSCR